MTLNISVILTVSLITTIFYFHPSTSAATSVFRTVTILTEANGRMAETFVEINDIVRGGEPIFMLDSVTQEAAVEQVRRSIEEIDAAFRVATAQLRETEARIVQARGNSRHTFDEFETRHQIFTNYPDAIPEREANRARVRFETEQGFVDATVAARDVLQTRIDYELPTRRASSVARLKEAEVGLAKTLVVAGTGGVVQQFALRPGDVVNPMLRPAGVLVPSRKVTGLAVGFGQIESQVIEPGMIGEVACVAMPWQIVPMVVTVVQDVIASCQIRPTDQLVDLQQLSAGGSITVIMEPLFPGVLDWLPHGASCIANIDTSNHDRLQDERLGALHRTVLNAIDATGLIHAAILRIQSLLMPVQLLILKGH